MYTRCPDCNTYFRVTAENLRAANGEVCCGACESEFNALTSLVDAIPDQFVDDNDRGETPDELVDDGRRDEATDDDPDEIMYELVDYEVEIEDGVEIEVDEVPEGVDRLENETWNQDEWRALLDSARESPEKDDASADDIAGGDDRNEVEPEVEPELYGEIIVLESGPDDAGADYSDADEDDNDDAPEDPEYVVAEQSQTIEREFRNIDADEPGDHSEDFHRWLAGGLEADDAAEDRPKPTIRRWLVVSTILTFTLFGQFLHYNRDSLAADPKYGGTVRGLYGQLGSTLYPEWELRSFEVRGTEAVAGDSASSALNILANVLIVGDQPVGMPMIRVVLHDRWSATVASGIFQPDEYLGSRDSRPRVLEPGSTLPIKISVADPGSEARGYVVDICLPRRATGLQCQLARDPFRQ